MIGIKIQNSTCQLSNVPAKMLDKLMNTLVVKQQTKKSAGLLKRYWEKRKKFGKTPNVAQAKTLKDLWKLHLDWINVNYLVSRRGSFPTGLLYAVEEFFIQHNLEYTTNDQRIVPTSVRGMFDTPKFDYEPYLEQRLAAQACKPVGRGIIVAPTAFGKSAVCALLAYELQVRTLFVVPTLALKRQLTASLRASFPETRIGTVADRGNIAVENVDALDLNVVLDGYDCVVIDEFHHSGAETYRKLNKKAWSNVYYKFGLTATPFRSNDAERYYLESVLSKVIYEVTYALAVQKGYICPLEAYYVDLPKKKLECDPTSWPAVYKELVVDREDRNAIINDVFQNLTNEGISTLCLVKQINHGESLHSMGSLDVPFVQGINDDNEWIIKGFNAREHIGIIGTEGCIGEGVDTKPCEWVILASGGKSKNGFMQKVGRTFRIYANKTSGKVLMFRDPSHKWMLEHFNACKKYLRDEYGIVPQQISL